MARPRLTEKQLDALIALAYPDAAHALMWWAEARASWQGPRQTLGSLIGRGYATYGDDGWKITDEGRAALREVEHHG